MDKTQNKETRTPTAEQIRKLAQEVREYKEKTEKAKQVKCAQYIVGLTSLMHLKNKLRGL